MAKPKHPKELQRDLASFTGTETWYRHGLVRDVLFTEGVKYLADEAGAYWLIDEIALAQWHPILKHEPFQVWRITVSGSSAVIVCDDGNGNVLVTKDISLTDFPLPEQKLYFSDNVILLPSEN